MADEKSLIFNKTFRDNLKNNRVLVLSKDEYNLLNMLIPVIIKENTKKIETETGLNKKALKISVDILDGLLSKLKNIKF